MLEPVVVSIVGFTLTALIASVVNRGAAEVLARRYELRVIRVLDYVHYPEEKVLYCGRYLLGLASSGYFLNDPKVLGVTVFGTLFTLILELFASKRRMDFKKYAPNTSTVLALVSQAFFEGGIYFTNYFTFAQHLKHRQWPVVTVYAMIFLLFPWLSVFRGWPRRRSHNAVLSKRPILSSVPGRLLSVPIILALSRRFLPNEEASSCCGPSELSIRFYLAASQFVFLTYYFAVLRFLGRSYVDVLPPPSGPPAAVVPPPLIDILATIYRGCEPVFGGIAVLAFAVPALGYC